MSAWAIIAAAGSGSRMGGDKVKTLQILGGRACICYSVEKLKRHCEGVIIAARASDILSYKDALSRNGLTADAYVLGGETRRDSVRNALAKLPEDCDLVLVHDGARPLLSDELILRVMDSARRLGSGVPALMITDTVKRVNLQGQSVDSLERRMLRTVQTPQAFHRTIIQSAYDEVDGMASDDASMVEQLGLPVHLVEGDPHNIKLTLPGDLERAEELLRGSMLPRVGLGYDMHRLVEGRPLILCGVEIPHEKGLMGHSDADVALHALIDALLGSVGLHDIGHQFPDSDPQYKGISSLALLQKTLQLLRGRGVLPYNVDITLALERPKLRPHILAMKEQLSRALAIPLHRVSVKATTTEGLGPEGRGEGVSARAVALVHTAPFEHVQTNMEDR